MFQKQLLRPVPWLDMQNKLLDILLALCVEGRVSAVAIRCSVCLSLHLCVHFLKSITALSAIKYFCLNCQHPEMKC